MGCSVAEGYAKIFICHIIFFTLVRVSDFAA